MPAWQPDQHICACGNASPTVPAAAGCSRWRRWCGCPTSRRSLPHVVRMEPGLAEVAVPKWFFVYNHLHTVHAIASCNAAEIAMGMLMEATVPTQPPVDPEGDERAVPREGDDSLRAQAQLDPPDFASITDGVELVVPVSVIDSPATKSCTPTSPPG